MLRINVISALLQLIFWLLFISAPFLNDQPFEHNNGFFVSYILKHICLLFLFYLNYFYLIPNILRFKGLNVYVVISLLSIFLIFITINVIEQFLIRPVNAPLLVFVTIIPVIQNFSISTSFKLIVDYFKQSVTQKKLEEENKIAQIQFLRSQINPHFLFNTLNNIMALIRIKPADAEDAVAKLSKLMRYMLKTNGDSKIVISEEIDYLQSYIELQKLRLPDNFNFKYTMVTDSENYKIEPLLIISLIENTFKHGVNGTDTDFIDIDLTIKNGLLKLTTKNSLTTNETASNIVSGIGIQNIKKRLELLYKGKYAYNAINSDHIYSTELKLNLNEV